MSARMPHIIDRLFSRLQGIYGTAFTNKFSTGLDQSGIDRGMANAKAVWADDLAGFSDNMEAISYALKNLDPKFPPSSREFLALCRMAPKKEAPAIGYTPTAEDRQRTREAADAAAKALKPKVSDGIDRHWATHPRSALQLKMIFDAAKRDQRFESCVAEMVADGICTVDGHLLKQYRDQQFFKVAA